MNKPESYNRSSNTVIKASEFYFNIDTENKPLFTPISFYNSQEDDCISYEQQYRPRNHQNYVSLIRNFLDGATVLEQFKIKDKEYLVGKGCIFRYFCDENTIDHLYPICIFCFDENTNWESQKNYKIIVSTKELDNNYNKALRPKLQKILDKYVVEHESDLIYTSNIEKYCFNPAPKLRFKSIKEQKEWLENLVNELEPKTEVVKIEELVEEKLY